MLRLLRRNWMVAIALDLDVRKGVFVDFFGLPASTSDGMARLAMATGAAVAPCVLVRQGDTIHHQISIRPLIEIVTTAIARNACARTRSALPRRSRR